MFTMDKIVLGLELAYFQGQGGVTVTHNHTYTPKLKSWTFSSP